MRFFAFTSFLLLLFQGLSQSPLKLHFTPKVGTQNFALEQLVLDASSKTFEANYFNYYISKLHVIHDGGQDLDLSDTIFLVKHDAHILDLGLQSISNVEKVTFGVGVPQELNHLDISQYPENHPLSYQTPSMQWGWTAGYTHMIVGGNADSNDDGQTDAYFEIHCLGDGNYYEIEVVTGALDLNGGKEIFIDCNLDTWLGTTNLGTNGIMHGETGVNYTVMKNVILRPVFTASSNAGVQELSDFNFTYKMDASGTCYINWNNVKVDELQLVDLSGKLLQDLNVASKNTAELSLKQGTYVLRFLSKGRCLKSASLIF